MYYDDTMMVILGSVTGKVIAAPIVVAIAFSSLAVVAAEEPISGGFLSDVLVDAGITVESNAGFRWNADPRQQLELLASPELDLTFPDGPHLLARARLRGDLFDDLEPGQSEQHFRSPESRRLFIGDYTDIELRELFIEQDFEGFFVRLGKQQIVWGQADGLKVLDVVNPQTFREFILDDFADSRIPLWSSRAEVQVDEATLQFVWIPDQTYNEFPDPGASFAPSAPQVVPQARPGFRVVRQQPDRPSRFFVDSDVGVRVSGFLGGWDLSANYLYHIPDTPGFFLVNSDSASGPVTTVTPRYERSHLVGGTFSNSVGELVVRGEVAYSSNLLFVADPTVEPVGVVDTGEFGYVIGLDWYGFDDMLLSAQAFQSIAIDDQAGLIRDRVDTTLTVLVKVEFMDGDLILEAGWLQNVNHGDGLFRPKVSYKIRDDLDLSFGADLFYGSRDGVFGQFKDEDRVVVGVKWSW